jgi:hypothetical protein
MVVGFVGVELARSSSRRSPGLLDGRNGIDHLFQHPAVVDVGSRQRESERDALCIGEDMPLGALPCRDLLGWDLSLSPPFGRHRGAVESSPAEVDGVAPPQAVEEHALEAIPNSGPLPVPQAPPAGHTGPTAHLLWQQLPRSAGAQDEQNACESGTIWNTGPTALRLGWFRRKQRLDHRPQFIRKKGLTHTPPNAPIRVLLGALR